MMRDVTRQQQTSTNYLQTLQSDITLYNTKIYNTSTAKVCNFVILLELISNNNRNNKISTYNKLQNYKLSGLSVLQDIVADVTRYTSDFEKVENYELALKDNFKGWHMPVGMKWFNNGQINKRCSEYPEGFVPGRLK